MSATRRLEFIARTQLTSGAATVSFTSIPTDFRKFFIVCYIVNDGTAGRPGIRLNNDSVANYARQLVEALDTTVTGLRNAALASFIFADNLITASGTALFTASIIKPVAAEAARIVSNYGYIDTDIKLCPQTGQWTNTADLISRIDLIHSSGAGNWAAGTRMLLYGSKD